MHKEFVGLYFRGSADNFIACAVMISWDSKQPQNQQTFELLEIYYSYGITNHILLLCVTAVG